MITTQTASIVLYLSDLVVIKKAINSVLNSAIPIKLYLIDNSPTDYLKRLVEDPRVEYLHNPSNLGFGASHNIAIEKAIVLGSEYHFIVNPDVFFNEEVTSTMVSYMKLDPTIGMLMPEILNIDGSIQNLPKLLPTPWSVFWRKIKIPTERYKKFINQYELRSVPRESIYNTPILSGCFTLLNLEAIKEIGVYDHAFFMYFEDWDLSRRMHEKFKTIYFPTVSVYHEYDSGANKSGKIFRIFVISSIMYFNKWGWFFDSQRKRINKRALSQFT